MRKHVFVSSFVCMVAVATPALAFQNVSLEDLKHELERLKAEFEAMKTSYDSRIGDLEKRISASPAVDTAAPAPKFEFPAPPQSSQAPVRPGEDTVFSGNERTLQGLNPEISITGDLTGRLSDRSSDPEFNRFVFDGFEMAIQHPLDPFSQAKFFLSFEDGQFSLEEGYMSWESLPGSLGLKVGRFHNNFGKFNRYHKHALPWADRDLPTRELFGEEGLIGTGASLTWLPPKLPFADTNEFSFEVINNDNDRAFSGRGFGDPVFVGRVLNYYDVTDSAYFEWGLSAATSHWDHEKQKRSTVYNADLSYRWQPAQRALYRSFELRGELFYDDREDWPGGNPLGFYVSGEYQLNRQWFAGTRYQFAKSLENNQNQIWTVSPFLTFWQSEFVRLRAQYDLLRRNFDENDNRFFLQFTWSLGPHKHEAY